MFYAGVGIVSHTAAKLIHPIARCILIFTMCGLYKWISVYWDNWNSVMYHTLHYPLSLENHSVQLHVGWEFFFQTPWQCSY